MVAVQLAMGNQVATASGCINGPANRPGSKISNAMPICCEAALNEVFLDLSFQEGNVDEDVKQDVRFIESSWMQQPVIAAFEKRLASLERERKATLAVEAKLAALEQEKLVAISSEDYARAKICKDEIDRLKVSGIDEFLSLPGCGGQGHRTQWRTRLGSMSPAERAGSSSQPPRGVSTSTQMPVTTSFAKGPPGGVSTQPSIGHSTRPTGAARNSHASSSMGPKLRVA